MSEHERTKQLPIGYWLKRADELLTQRIDEIQREHGLTRLGWQVLNVVRERGTATHDEIATLLRPFAEDAVVHDTLASLTERGLVERSAETACALTPTGAALYEKALHAQQAIRQRAVAGISDAEYAVALDVIRRLVENLA